MQDFLEAYNLWETIAEDKPITPLPTNLTIVQIKSHNEEKVK